MAKEQWVKDIDGNQEVNTKFIVLEKELRPFASKEGQLKKSIAHLFENYNANEVKIFKGKTVDPEGFALNPEDYVLFYK